MLPDYPRLPNVITHLGAVKLHTWRVGQEITRKWVIHFAWGIAETDSGEHPLGRALDFMVYAYGAGAHDPGEIRQDVGDQIANYLWEHRERLHVAYIVWNRRIISADRASEGWRDYDGEHPHHDHVHVSFHEHATYLPPAVHTWITKHARGSELRGLITTAQNELNSQLLDEERTTP